jgi:hypothetical protein
MFFWELLKGLLAMYFFKFCLIETCILSSFMVLEYEYEVFSVKIYKSKKQDLAGTCQHTCQAR